MVKLMDLAARQHFIKIKYTPAKELNFRASGALGVSGANAQSAVPALIEIADQNISRESKISAVGALANIGSTAKEAVPSFLRWAANTDPDVRYFAIVALGKNGTEPDRFIPVVVNALLHDPQPHVRFGALRALQDFGPNAKLAVPALVELLNDPDADVRGGATNALKQIDPEAAAKAGVK
ncbi:MAG: HEAT repeat domain-containing protein [Limisphaerales bacterium]